MNKYEILQNIINSGGDCEALHALTQIHLCRVCPMSKLQQRPDGTYLSCWASLIKNTFATETTEQYRDYTRKIYYEKAIELMQDILIEDMLKGEAGAKDP